jgi:hypothetical protein
MKIVHPLTRALDQAYRWLCNQRRDYPPDADVWDLRFHWESERMHLASMLESGRYRLGPMSMLTTPPTVKSSICGARAMRSC